MSNQTENKQSSMTEGIEDLPVENAATIKGGPSTQSKRAVVLKCDVVDGSATAEFNHNETVSEDNEAQNDEPQELADLAVNEDAELEIKGGMQYRAKKAELPPN